MKAIANKDISNCITKGKIYDVFISYFVGEYRLTGDDTIWIEQSNFYVIDEYREIQLNKILNDLR